MIMETLSCGYPVPPSGLAGTPMSPPSTPTGTDSYAPQLYSQTQYSQPGYSTSQIHNSYSKYDADTTNNNIYDNINNNNDDDQLLSDLSSLSISESDERFSDISPVSDYSEDCISFMSQSPPTPPPSLPSSVSSSRSKSKKSRSKSINKPSVPASATSQQGGESKRKDSFVYDVRLPDEQVLLFVPDLDLVKSHLMFAVREEVDVLKERIVELMDRIKNLECENSMLRQYASPEVLQQLQTQMSHQQMQQPPHHSSTS